MLDAKPSSTDTIPVYVLLCSRHVPMAVRFVGSLMDCCRTPISVTILDDGSLTARDVETLARALGSARIVTRDEYIGAVEESLAGYRHCQAYLKSHAFATKLFAPAGLSRGSDFMLCDSDILFVRPFVFNPDGHEIERGQRLVYMQDIRTAYSVSFARRHLSVQRFRLAERVNAGLLYVGRHVFDLDVIEWFLGDPRNTGVTWVVEQTVFAALAARTPDGGAVFDPEQVVMPTAGMKPASIVESERIVAVHFISPARHLISDCERVLREQACAIKSAATVELRTVAAEYISPGRAIYRAIESRLRRQ